jgi:hypothetical protein
MLLDKAAELRVVRTNALKTDAVSSAKSCLFPSSVPPHSTLATTTSFLYAINTT